MQITAKGGTIVLDYYPIKNWDNVIDPDNVLRILSFKGDTIVKRIITKDTMGNEILDRVDNYNYIITDNSKGLPQFASHSVEQELNKLELSEV
tara:strand:+ start:237 stop:515 length:279 start_codon:yes stop_codon:yes gene_type:complete